MPDDEASPLGRSAVVLARVVRGGVVESEHHGHAVAVDAAGAVVFERGEADVEVLARSSLKPLQAVAMVTAGLDLEPRLLALACASHNGEAKHLDGARRILSSHGLDETALQNTPDVPIGVAAQRTWVAAGNGPTSLAQNCSGKHAAMLATCVRSGWDTATYRDPEHPLQRGIRATVAELTGDPVRHVTVDGCGAPLFAISLYGLARAFGRIAAAHDGAERQVADAIRAHPEWASGTRRDELALHRAVPGLVAKAGAEAVYAVGLPDGRGVALKISDGSPRARAVAMAGVLMRLGLEHDTLTEQASAPVLGHGERVGEIRPVAETLARLMI